MTRGDRARLHECFADWLRDEAPKRSLACDETLGYHLEQAVAERRALGLSEEHDAQGPVLCVKVPDGIQLEMFFRHADP